MNESPTPNQPVKRFLIRTILGAGLVYLGILGFLMYNETNLVYPGSKYPRGNWKTDEFVFEEVTFESADQTRLVGWFLPCEQSTSDQTSTPTKQSTDNEDSQPVVAADSSDDLPGKNVKRTILLCHGNGENCAQSAATNGIHFRDTLNADVFVFDYRGFGKSEGTPFEQGVLEDSEAALEWLCQRTGKSPSEVILVGHSLGGGPAVHLGAKLGCRALILQRTFSRLTDPGQNQYPWLPVKYVMRNRYPSTQKIKNCPAPVFQSHGDADRLIPIRFAKELFEASPADKKVFFEVPGMTHWDPLPANYWTQMAQFVDECEATKN